MGERMDDVVARFLAPDGPAFACINARVEDALLLLPDGCADLVDGDPPYGTGQWQRAEAGAGRDPRAVHTTESWDTWDPAWIPEALRASRGPVTVCSPNGRVEELLRLGREAGVATRLHMWVKPDPRPRFAGQPAYGFEPVIVYRSNLQDGGEMDYTIASAPREGRDHDAEGHPHQKPVDLPRRLIRQSTPPGGLVVSLFAGSGTTAEAAILEGRRVLAVEADPAWCERLTARAGRALERLHRQPALLPTQAPLPLEAA